MLHAPPIREQEALVWKTFIPQVIGNIRLLFFNPLLFQLLATFWLEKKSQTSIKGEEVVKT